MYVEFAFGKLSQVLLEVPFSFPSGKQVEYSNIWQPSRWARRIATLPWIDGTLYSFVGPDFWPLAWS